MTTITSNPRSDRLQVNVFSALRFPLIVAVVIWHSRFVDITTSAGTMLIDAEQFPVYWCFSSLLSNVLVTISVPLFFLMSGYFFFRNVDNFDSKIYREKLKRRLKTLLLPYLLWNLIVVAILLLSEKFIPGMMSGAKKSVLQWGPGDWFANLFTPPIAYQFWFIRDLFVFCLLTPLFYKCLTSRIRLPFIVALIALWILGDCPILPERSFGGLVFFCLGAFLSLNRVILVDKLIPFALPLGLVWGTMSVLEVWGPISLTVGVSIIISTC